MIILLGGSGYVGSEFRRQLTESQTPHISVSRRRCDYSRCDDLVNLLRETKATFVINAAGYTGKPNVDACELHKAECLAGNAVLPGTVAQSCRVAGDIPWGHVSSGCIYTGSRPDGTGFSESDPPNFCFRTNNCSFYSGCKALGEECLADNDNVYVWRLRIPFDHHDSTRNYLSKLLRYSTLLEARNSISHLGEFVSASLMCWQNRVPFGTYNVTNSGSITTREVVDLLRSRLTPDRTFSFFESEEQFMQVAARTPRSNCVMDNRKLLSTGIAMSDVHDAIELSLANWTEER